MEKAAEDTAVVEMVVVTAVAELVAGEMVV